MFLNKLSSVIVVLFFCISSCREPKTTPPKVEFDLSEMSVDDNADTSLKVIDNEWLFSDKEKSDLELIIEKAGKERGVTINVLTMPSKIKVNNEWVITRLINLSGIAIIISKSGKTVDIGIDPGMDTRIFDNLKEEILRQFKEGYFYKGVSQIIENLIKNENKLN